MPEDHAMRGLANSKAAETSPRVVKPSPYRFQPRNGNWGGTVSFQRRRDPLYPMPWNRDRRARVPFCSALPLPRYSPSAVFSGRAAMEIQGLGSQTDNPAEGDSENH